MLHHKPCTIQCVCTVLPTAGKYANSYGNKSARSDFEFEFLKLIFFFLNFKTVEFRARSFVSDCQVVSDFVTTALPKLEKLLDRT